MQHVSEGPKQPVRDILDRLSAKHLVAMEDNTKLKACCRKAKDHFVEFFKTHEKAEGPDLAIFECACGRKHRRISG